MKSKSIMTIIVLCLVILIVIGYRHFKIQFTDNAWITDLGYDDSEVYLLTFHLIGDRSCPEIPVGIGNDEYRLLFDTGCGSGMFFTNVLGDKIRYSLLGQSEALNRDGSHRGWDKRVVVDELTVFGETYSDVETSISDWTMYSSERFNGAIGLAYFKSKVITLDYSSHRIAVSSNPINYSKLKLDEYVVLPLYKSSSQGQEDLPFFKAEYNGETVIVYLDTGKNHSYIHNPNSELSMTDKPKDFINVPIKIGDSEIMLQDVVEVYDIAQADGLPYPTIIELNSDQLWKCNLLVTFDLIEQKIILSKL